MSAPRDDWFPVSLAIAGAWGYIGRKFLAAALARGLRPYVYDPGPLPADIDPNDVVRVATPQDFDALPAECFHLPLHPEHRRLDALLARPDGPLVLNEKPMAAPEHPEECARIVAAVDRSPAVVLFDFPELYDPLTARILAHLAQFRAVRIDEIVVVRSKDREDPANPRNAKRMVPIQYQETVHCLAFVLFVLGRLAGSVPSALAGGVRLAGTSEPYAPPNPKAYPYVVDGRCRFEGTFGAVRVVGETNFKRGAPWAKRRLLRGVADGRPFVIDVSYLEGAKSLRIDGVPQPCDPAADSYAQVLATATRWARHTERALLMNSVYPNPRFARVTYQLSSALWRACRDRRVIAFPSLDALEGWDAGFAAQVPQLGRY